MAQRILIIVLCFLGMATAQEIQKPKEYTVVLTDDGGPGGAPLYVGEAVQLASSANIWLRRSNSTLTTIADSSNTSTVTCATACGVWIGQRVSVSGATVATQLNGFYTVLTTPSSTTFTFTTAGVADATYNESTLTISIMEPLTTAEVWKITVFKYNASNNNVTITNAVPPGQNREWNGGLAWSSRALY